MALDLVELKDFHDKSFISNQQTRERASDDLVFYWVTQWDDSLLEDSQLSYRGEFNILRKAGRQIMTDLRMNPVQIDFIPRDETRDDAAETIDGLYRADCNHNKSIEAFSRGQIESVVCGVGAWELYTEYATKKVGETNQVIRRRPIIEANNNCFWDPNSKLIDKSDAKHVSILEAFSHDGYVNLYNELTGENIDRINGSSFKHPEHSYTFPWILGEAQKIYVVKFYHKEIIDDEVSVLRDPYGNIIHVRQKKLIEIEDDLMGQGYDFVESVVYKRCNITKYIASGEEILKKEVIAGEHIPVIPTFGEHAFVEGEEHWDGVTRLTKDPQRLRNFAGSYLADILSRSPRQKPIFWQEQIAGYEDMYSESGAENNYPYLLANRKAGDGTEMPVGPVGMLPEQPMPTALPHVLALSKESAEDVANPGIPQDIADPDISGRAVYALQARIDMQSEVYQDHTKHAKRRDAEIYASMASEIYDVPRRIKVEDIDGTRREVQLMDQAVDEETGNIIIIRDLHNSEFEVYSRVGPSYTSQKEQTIDRLGQLRQGMAPDDPISKALLLKQLVLMDGTDFEDIRDYANKQLLLQGIRKPKTPEEEQLLKEHTENKKPDPATLLAMAEMKKGEADLLEQKRKGIEMQIKAANERAKTQIDEFEAQTDRMLALTKAKQLGVQVEKDEIEKLGKTLDNTEKVINITQLLKSGGKLLKTSAGGG
jgi:hypothetical protein